MPAVLTELVTLNCKNTTKLSQTKKEQIWKTRPLTEIVSTYKKPIDNSIFFPSDSQPNKINYKLSTPKERSL